MTDMKDLVVYIAKSIVDDPSQVRVTGRERALSIHLRLTVARQDIGQVIGREARVVNAIRTLLRVQGEKRGKRVSLDIV